MGLVNLYIIYYNSFELMTGHQKIRTNNMIWDRVKRALVLMTYRIFCIIVVSEFQNSLPQLFEFEEYSSDTCRRGNGLWFNNSLYQTT